MATAISNVTMHELAHAFFLGDEYEKGIRETGKPEVNISLPNNSDAERHFNINTNRLISTSGRVKWAQVERVEKASAILEQVRNGSTPNKIEITLFPNEGKKWRQGDSNLYIRNPSINHGSLIEYNGRPIYKLYPKRGRYLPATIPTKKKQNSDNPATEGHSIAPGFTIVNDPSTDGDRIVLSVDKADTLPLLGDGKDDDKDDEYFFPPGSILLKPVRITPEDSSSLNLVLPGVHKFMFAKEQKPFGYTPLHMKDRAKDKDECSHLDDKNVITHGYDNKSDLDINGPFHRQRLIGLYEGAHHHNCNVFRPTGSCIMRAQYLLVLEELPGSQEITKRVVVPFDFCWICKYQIVNQINGSRHDKLDKKYPGSPR